MYRKKGRLRNKGVSCEFVAKIKSTYSSSGTIQKGVHIRDCYYVLCVVFPRAQQPSPSTELGNLSMLIVLIANRGDDPAMA